MANNKEYNVRMQKSLDHLSAEFATVRAGRANASVLDQIMVEYYGCPTPIQQVASISSPDPRSLVIQKSELGINPTNDGKCIRLLFPQLTEERRKDLVKQVKKYGEDCKVAIRNIRRDAIDAYKKQQKASEITEDDLKGLEKDMQKMTDDFIKKVDEMTAKKEKELYAI